MFGCIKGWCLGALLALLIASPVMALAPCGEVVVDNAGLLSPSEELQVAKAAEALEALGAVVRVRTSEDLGQFGSLEEATEMVCPSWGDARIVLWITTVSRDVGIYAGPDWASVLPDEQADRIVVAEMLPVLLDEQRASFAPAFIEPMEPIGELLKPVPVEAPAPEVTPLPREVAPQAPVVITKAPEANEWTFASVLAVIGGIVVLVLSFFGLQLFGRERARKDTLARTQQAAVLLGNQCIEILQGFNATKERLEGLFMKVKEQLHLDTMAELEQRFTELLLQADKANQDFNGNNNPAEPGQELGWYEAAHTSAKASKETLDGIAEAFYDVEQAIVAALALAEAMPEKVAALKATLSDYQTRVGAVGKAGLVVTNATATLAELVSGVAEVEALVAQRRHEEAMARIKALAEAGATAVAAAEALPKLKLKLEQKHDDLGRIFSRVPKELRDAAKAFRYIEKQFAPVCYESIVGNGTEAEECLDDVEDALAAAKKHLDAMAFAEAEMELDTAAELLRTVDTLLDAVMAEKERLDFAQAKAREELTEARRSIDEADAYLKRHDADTSDVHYAALKEGRALCEQVDGMLRKAKPNYPEALKLAMQADEFADGVLAKAEGEKALADKERRRATVLAETARQELTEVKQYIQNHRLDMTSDTLAAIHDFDARNLNLTRNHSTDVQIRQAIELSELVASVYASAKRDFSAAEARRAAVRRTREVAAESLREAARPRPVPQPRPAPGSAPVPRREEPAARKEEEAVSTGSARSWGTPRPSESTGATRSWRAASSPLSGAARSSGRVSSGQGTGASRKW